ncbi:AbrB family transcriptional regulator [Paenibacillus sp. WLX1005]|uniref:AbrB/MazE/SpoVT family DNA-binding domain-containing protein n=1 Tax=Paenibacillus sp. WLX1005 TaxID=3243766 RepID=UPI003983F533
MGKTNEIERKVTKFGNSLGISMTDALKKVGLGQGDAVTIDANPVTGEILIKKAKKISLPEGISPDFMDTLTDVMTEYDQTLRGLKDR